MANNWAGIFELKTSKTSAGKGERMSEEEFLKKLNGG
jgi:hypothetical protein